MKGPPIGFRRSGGARQVVCIPPEVRSRHVHFIGRPGMGKSTVMESMILYDAAQGHGVAVLDLHGRLVQRIAGLLPPGHAERVIYVDPGDPEWVPIWNPFRCNSPLGLSCVTDNLIGAFKKFMPGWGDRTEHLMRHAICAVLHLPGCSLLDVSNALRTKSDEGRQLRTRILKAIDNQVAKHFWQHDLARYSAAALSPAKHTLSKLLTSGTVSLMLSQGDSAFDFADIMDSGKILLVDLSRVGLDMCEILGCFVLSSVHITALSHRTGLVETPRPFHIFCDQAHRFMTEAMEDLLAEARRFNVSLTLAHQYMGQFSNRETDALSSVGSRIVFNVDVKDAQYLQEDLQGAASVEELTSLGIGRAIARMGLHVLRLETDPPPQAPKDHCRELIIAQSRAQYCRPASDVRRIIADRHRG